MWLVVSKQQNVAHSSVYEGIKCFNRHTAGRESSLTVHCKPGSSFFIIPVKLHRAFFPRGEKGSPE